MEYSKEVEFLKLTFEKKYNEAEEAEKKYIKLMREEWLEHHGITPGKTVVVSGGKEFISANPQHFGGGMFFLTGRQRLKSGEFSGKLRRIYEWELKE